MKETILFVCSQNKKTVQLNLCFGHLWFYPNMTVEFKANDGNCELLKPSEIVSKIGDKSSAISKSKNGL